MNRILQAANTRYLAFLSSLDDISDGTRALAKLTTQQTVEGRSYKGINFFSEADLNLCRAIADGASTISGLRNKDIRRLADITSPAAVSRQLKRFRQLGVLRRIPHAFKYYLTDFGRRSVLAALKIRELILIPALRPA